MPTPLRALVSKTCCFVCCSHFLVLFCCLSAPFLTTSLLHSSLRVCVCVCVCVCVRARVSLDRVWCGHQRVDPVCQCRSSVHRSGSAAGARRVLVLLCVMFLSGMSANAGISSYELGRSVCSASQCFGLVSIGVFFCRCMA